MVRNLFDGVGGDELMKCKHCKNGKYDKHTDTVECKMLNKTLFFDRADTCGDYEDNATTRKARERGTYNEG